VGGNDLDPPRRDDQDGGDRGESVELLHGALLCQQRTLSARCFPMTEKLRCVHEDGNAVVAHEWLNCR
ncbi:hypothetical protein, partial [Streptomyces sp900116325]|uniref:hypothetical protein n=1 Tax=Streptomyces sp. 900116325 TaxID=3154295 RepID=UPI0033CA8249